MSLTVLVFLLKAKVRQSTISIKLNFLWNKQNFYKIFIQILESILRWGLGKFVQFELDTKMSYNTKLLHSSIFYSVFINLETWQWWPTLSCLKWRYHAIAFCHFCKKEQKAIAWWRHFWTFFYFERQNFFVLKGEKLKICTKTFVLY